MDEHVDALNRHNTEEESVTKINMKKDSEHFTISEKTHYIFLKLFISILTTHLDWKLHLNDSIGNPENLQISAHTDCNKTKLTMLAETLWTTTGPLEYDNKNRSILTYH